MPNVYPIADEPTPTPVYDETPPPQWNLAGQLALHRHFIAAVAKPTAEHIALLDEHAHLIRRLEVALADRRRHADA